MVAPFHGTRRRVGASPRGIFKPTASNGHMGEASRVDQHQKYAAAPVTIHRACELEELAETPESAHPEVLDGPASPAGMSLSGANRPRTRRAKFSLAPVPGHTGRETIHSGRAGSRAVLRRPEANAVSRSLDWLDWDRYAAWDRTSSSCLA